jgi:hypothetical protein
MQKRIKEGRVEKSQFLIELTCFIRLRLIGILLLVTYNEVTLRVNIGRKLRQYFAKYIVFELNQVRIH